VRRFLFRTVSQIGVNYRGSALSAGIAGAVRGGDRLPWVEIEPGHDNFVPLASLTWQVHVHGEPRLGLAEICAELQLALHVFAWRSTMRRVGLLRGALYLVRPDGYVALADRHGDPARLREYGKSAAARKISGERLYCKTKANDGRNRRHERDASSRRSLARSLANRGYACQLLHPAFLSPGFASLPG
jgi:hypothetical protein